MKKLLLFGALLSLAFTNAQSTKYGLKAGYANSKFTTAEDLSDFEDQGMKNTSRSGFYIGGFVEQMVSDKFAVQIDAQYANLGGKLEYDFNIEGYTGTMNFDMARNEFLIPISAKYYVVPQFAVLAGPYIGFKSSHKVNIDIKDSNLPAEAIAAVESELAAGETEMENYMDESLKSSNFGLHFGAEYTVYKSLFVDARYNLGLSNLEKNSEGDSETKMNFFQVGVGYKF